MCSGELLERFEPTCRDTDVFTSTIAKCGQTWLTTLLFHLKTRAGQADLGGKGLMHHVPWLEIPWDPMTEAPYDITQRLAAIDRVPDPRVFKMHVLWDEIPRPEGSASKVVTITRDPRDVPYSMYAHLVGMRHGPFSSSGAPPFEKYFEMWFENGYYFKFIPGFWARIDDPLLLWIRYEDMKADPVGQARRLVSFLGWDVADAEVAQAVALSDFGHLQRTERTTVMPGHSAFDPDKRFFREGAVGRNRAHLTPEMEARIVARARAEFAPACVDHVFAQGLD